MKKATATFEKDAPKSVAFGVKTKDGILIKVWIPKDMVDKKTKKNGIPVTIDLAGKARVEEEDEDELDEDEDEEEDEDDEDEDEDVDDDSDSDDDDEEEDVDEDDEDEEEDEPAPARKGKKPARRR